MKGEQKPAIPLHPVSGGRLVYGSFEIRACRVKKDVVRVVIRSCYCGFDRSPMCNRLRFQGRQKAEVKIVIAEWPRGLLVWLSLQGSSNRIEQRGIEDCPPIEVLGMIRQPCDDRFTKTLQLIRR